MTTGPLDNICPHLSGKNEVACIEHRCRLFVQIMGQDPQTGEQINKWGCTYEFMPMLIIEGAQMGRQTGAAVESLRNEVVRLSQPRPPDPQLKRIG